MSSEDTTADAAEVQWAVLRRMSGSARLELACELSQAVRDLALAGLRSRHPDWSEPELMRELLRKIYEPAELPPDLR